MKRLLLGCALLLGACNVGEVAFKVVGTTVGAAEDGRTRAAAPRGGGARRRAAPPGFVVRGAEDHRGERVIADIVAGVRSGARSAVEVTRAHLSRSQADSLGCFYRVDAEGALA